MTTREDGFQAGRQRDRLPRDADPDFLSGYVQGRAAEAREAEKRQRARDQEARRRRVAHLPPGAICCDPNDYPRGVAAGKTGQPETPPDDVADPGVWLAGYRDGARERLMLNAP